MKSPGAQVAQVESLTQVAQVAVQARHLPSLRYLPSMHPGEQVVSFKRKPSLHPPHSPVVGPVQVVQAELHASQVPVDLLANFPSGQGLRQVASFKKVSVGQDRQVLRCEQVAQSLEHCLQTFVSP